MDHCYHLPEEVWLLTKQYLFHDKFRAKQVVKQHTALPYLLSLHQYKNMNSTLEYLRLYEAWVFRVLPSGQIISLVRKTGQEYQ